MNVNLTSRRHVSAESQWFRVHATETTVTIATDFGGITIVRNRKGLEVTLRPASSQDQVVQVVNPTGPDTYIADDHTATLRPIGQFTMAEMDNPAVRTIVEEWMHRRATEAKT